MRYACVAFALERLAVPFFDHDGLTAEAPDLKRGSGQCGWHVADAVAIQRHPQVDDVIVAGEALCDRESAGKPAASGLDSHFHASALAQRDRPIRAPRGVRDLLAMHLVPGLVHHQHDLPGSMPVSVN
jgi:hypothetical protein